MNLESSVLPVVAVSIPLVAAALANMFYRVAAAREISVVAAGVALVLAVLEIASRVFSGEVSETVIFRLGDGISLVLKPEPLGVIFALVSSSLWVVTALYTSPYLEATGKKKPERFHVFMALAISQSMGVAFAGNLFTMFAFYEMLTLVTYPLVTFNADQSAVKAGRLYLGYLLGCSLAFFLPAIAWVWSMAGTTDFIEGGLLASEESPYIAGALLLLFVAGIAKAAIMPFHRWLPAAMVAPTPASALLHAVAVVKAGVFCVLKVIFYVLGTEKLAELTGQSFWAGEWLIYLTGFSVVAASLMALSQKTVKGVLAYSTIANLSLVVLAAMGLSGGVAGAALHIATHSVGKITLFLAAGAIYAATRKARVDEMDGTGKILPVAGAAFIAGAVSLLGAPFTAGAISKTLMLSGSGLFTFAVVWFSTFTAAAYYIWIAYRMFFRKYAGPEAKTPIAMNVSLLLCIALIFGFPFFQEFFVKFAERL